MNEKEFFLELTYEEESGNENAGIHLLIVVEKSARVK